MATDPIQPQLDSTHEAANAAVDQLYGYAGQLLTDLTSKSAAMDSATGQVQALTNQNTQLQQQLAAAQKPSPTPIGSPTSITTDAFNGFKIKGDGLTLNGLVAIRYAQNGIGGQVTNTTINNAVSNGNNTQNHDVYGEGGGGKWVASKKLTINNNSASDNQGVALWFDSSCDGVNVNGGIFKNSIVAGPNSGKQVDLIRIEISKNVNIDSVTCVCAPGQNTAVHFHSAQLSSLTNSTITGQVAVTADSREPISDVTIKGNHITGSIYDGGANCPNLVIEGNTYTVPKGHAIAFLKGKTQYTIADMQAVGFEKSGTGKVVNT